MRNDSSDDNSLMCIKKTSKLASMTSVSVVNMSYFHGLELSMNAGIDISIGDLCLNLTIHIWTLNLE